MLILVRHGEVPANASGLLLGRRDEHLNELGRRQAAAVASVLGLPARVVSSPLARARETATALGLPVEVDPRWVELDYGAYEGTPAGAAGRAGLGSPPRRADPSFSPPGGESLAAVGERVREACEGLAAEASVADVVVVSHVSPIKAAVAWALGVGDATAARMHLGVASICRVGFASSGPVLHSFNERSHLDRLASPPMMSTTTLTIPGIHCDHCKSAIEGALGHLDGVQSAQVSVADRTVAVDYDESVVTLQEIKDTIVEQGYDLPA